MIMTQEAGLLKAKEEFRKIEAYIHQATREGMRMDVLEANLWDQMLGLGRLLMNSFVAGHAEETGSRGNGVGPQNSN